jgi:hypothetical protein
VESVISANWSGGTGDIIANLRHMKLVLLIQSHTLPPAEVRAAMSGGTPALLQLAAQYGLLKPGMQGAK